MKVEEENLSQISFQLIDQELILDAFRALFWVEENTLIVSDLHLGKAGHFRKNGIPIPKSIHISDLKRLDVLIKKYHPQKVLFLGDLFHSVENREWMDFIAWSQAHDQLEQVLVQGNHDILDAKAYQKTRIEIHEELVKWPFHFSHEPMETNSYNISGHIHPGIRLHGPARQVLTLPCFYFTKKQGILPAFGNFTGQFKLKPKNGDRVFAISADSIIALVG